MFTFVETSDISRVCSDFLNLSALGLLGRPRGAGYPVSLEGEIGDAAEDGGVSSDRRERKSSLPEDREEEMEPAVCPALDLICRHNSGSSTGGSNDLPFKEFVEVD